MKEVNRFDMRFSFLAFALAGVCIMAHGAPRTEQHTANPRSGARQLVTGPAGFINEAIAAGATVEITLQPVEPKTQPASSYPAGSSIMDQTLTLGSVPARLWIDVLVTGWAPELLNAVQVTISATDADMDGGGYSGASADCAGGPGGGDLTPAMQPCWGNCENLPELVCTRDQDCRLCSGGANDGLPCSSSSACPGGTCPSISSSNCLNMHNVCRSQLTGLVDSCPVGEPSRCINWDGVSPGGYFPAGLFCEPAFKDGCHPEFIAAGIGNLAAVDLSTYDSRFGITVFGGDESLVDFSPSYLGTFVIDAPADARGTYTIDLDEANTFALDPNFPPGNQIPIAVLRSAVIDIPCALEPDPSGLGKTRFISFSVPSYMPAAAALRVTPLSLHHVVPPYTDGVSTPFTAFEFGPNCAEAGGCVRWVGPPTQYFEATSSSVTFYAASLQCTPHYQDWSTVGLLHVTGSAIVPSSLYEVEIVNESCTGDEENCMAVSLALSVGTTRWGDVEALYNPPSSTAQPDLGDVAALVSKFRSAPGAPIKARALIAGGDAFGNINSLNLDVGFGQIAACVEGFRGRPYPHTISACP